jgi:hypothetical protein
MSREITQGKGIGEQVREELMTLRVQRVALCIIRLQTYRWIQEMLHSKYMAMMRTEQKNTRIL